jgi:hypothetical protein
MLGALLPMKKEFRGLKLSNWLAPYAIYQLEYFYRWNCMIWVYLPRQNWDDKVQERDYQLQLYRYCHMIDMGKINSPTMPEEEEGGGGRGRRKKKSPSKAQYDSPGPTWEEEEKRKGKAHFNNLFGQMA